MEEVMLLDPPNELPSVKEMYAFVSVDEEGREGLCGLNLGNSWTPAITANPRLLPQMREALLREFKRSTKKLRLVKFCERVVVEDY